MKFYFNKPIKLDLGIFTIVVHLPLYRPQSYPPRPFFHYFKTGFDGNIRGIFIGRLEVVIF